MAKGDKLKKAFESEPARDYDELKKQFLVLQKGANDRLYELEQVAKKGDAIFRGVLKYAYASADADVKISNKTGEPIKRFKGAAKNYQMLLGQVNDLKRFLSMQTSTKTGIKQKYIAQTETMNSKYGINLTWQQFVDYMQKGLFDKMLESGFGSSSAFITIAELQKTADKIGKDVSYVIDNHIKSDTDSHTKTLIEKAISQYGTELKDLLS